MSVPERIGRYEVIGHLATGGMAEILLGRLRGPSGFERPVVIKRILPHMAREKSVIEMFVDEARIVAGIRHPNVVHVHELGNEGNELFLVLEYLEGESAAGISRRLRVKDERLEFALGAQIVADACAGLHAAHELTDGRGVKRNLVHRDVSPQNIFVTYDGAIKLLDFGIATAADRMTKTEVGQLKGKFEYMSPEHCLGEPLDRRTDIFGAGVVLYELTTGHRLFKRANHLLTFNAICKEPITPPSEIVPDYPKALEAIVLHALAKKRDERYANALEMRRALLRVVRDLGGPRNPVEGLATLMHRLFSDRISQKEELLRRVTSGREVGELPAADTDDSVEIPVVTMAVDSPALEPKTVVDTTHVRRRPRSMVLAGGLAALVSLAVTIAVVGRHRAAPVPVPLASASAAVSAASAGASATAPAPSNVASAAAPGNSADKTESILITVDTVPPGAKILLNGSEIGASPTVVSVARGTKKVRLDLRRDGYAPLTEQVLPEVDQRLLITLTPLPSPPRPPAAPKPSATADAPGFRRFD